MNFIFFTNIQNIKKKGFPFFMNRNCVKSVYVFLGGGLFICLGIIPLEKFSLIWRRHHCRWRAANLDLSSAIQQWGIFSVPCLLWHGKSVYNGHLRGPSYSHLLMSVLQWSCHYLFYLGLSRLWFQHPIFRFLALGCLKTESHHLVLSWPNLEAQMSFCWSSVVRLSAFLSSI